eukprot:5877021-Alexandrium_andersonii.AAC.1
MGKSLFKRPSGKSSVPVKLLGPKAEQPAASSQEIVKKQADKGVLNAKLQEFRSCIKEGMEAKEVAKLIKEKFKADE